MKTQQQMANEYGIHRSTFKRRLKQVGIDLPRGLITPKNQALIYDILGSPEKNKPNNKRRF